MSVSLQKIRNVRDRLVTAKLMVDHEFPQEGKTVLATLDSFLKANMSSKDWFALQRKDAKREKCIAGMLSSGKFVPNEVQNLSQMISNAQRHLSVQSNKVASVA